jgi:hypothetical protein
VKLPAELSASIGVGVTLGAMMGDKSLGKARESYFLLSGFFKLL